MSDEKPKENINTDAAKLIAAIQLIRKERIHEQVDFYLEGMLAGIQALQMQYLMRTK
jgi:hypothetical protein